MLKFRIIFSSFLFLLLVGMNSNARASVKGTDAVENSADNQQSKKDSKEQSSGEIITDLDFFGAFSLVNVQLQWRDLVADLNEEDADSNPSFDPNEIFVEESQFFLPSVEKERHANHVAIVEEAIQFRLVAVHKVQHDVRFASISNEQQELTIAYIQNCGTYPKS